MKFTIIFLLLFINDVFALKVGVTAGPHAIILEEVKKIALRENLTIEIIEFNDFILPNAALDSKEIDINSYQHQPFLDEQIRNRGYNLTSVAKTIILPMGIYSKKHKNLEISINAKISIPNDPTNGGRALLLLKKANLIELKTLDNPTILDITSNNKNIKIIELEAPQIPRSMEDVDYAVVNADWILLSDIPLNSALLTENVDSPYVNLIVIRKEDIHREDIKQFVSIYQSEEIKQFIKNKFNSAVIPSW